MHAGTYRLVIHVGTAGGAQVNVMERTFSGRSSKDRLLASWRVSNVPPGDEYRDLLELLHRSVQGLIAGLSEAP